MDDDGYGHSIRLSGCVCLAGPAQLTCRTLDEQAGKSVSVRLRLATRSSSMWEGTAKILIYAFLDFFRHCVCCLVQRALVESQQSRDVSCWLDRRLDDA